MSTRGQNLPGLIQSLSSGNLAGMRNRPRRRSSIGAEELSQQTSHTSDIDTSLSLQTQVLSSTSNWSPGGDSEGWMRRLSIPASLITPQMRSQRLIGMWSESNRTEG